MRVIAGKFRNRSLKAGKYFRPTSDRVRETLFNILQNEIEGSVFVDAFAGSGAVGIEALSRGAAMVYFLEYSRKALEILQSNLMECCQGEPWRVYSVPVLKGLELIHRDTSSVDILFFDPPYEFGLYPQLLQRSAELFPHATYIVEASTRTASETPSGIQLIKERNIGGTSLSFYRM